MKHTFLEMSDKRLIGEELGPMPESGVPGTTAAGGLAPSDRMMHPHLATGIRALVENGDELGVAAW